MSLRTFVRRLHGSSRGIDLNGIFIPLTTPFKANQEICFDSLKSNLAKYEKIPFKGYLIAGTNGEAPCLSPQERIDLVKFVRENSNKEKMIVGGATSESTKTTCHLAEEMSKVGADAVLIMPPFYFKKRMTESAIIEHYKTVADNANLDVVIYNNTFVTGIDIGTSTLAKLAKHPRIKGVKDSDIRKCAVTVLETKGQNFDVVIGSAGYLLGAMLTGCSGGMNGLAGILGNELCLLYRLIKEKKIEEASKLQIQLAGPDALLLADMGVPGLKAAMDMMGYVGGVCRRPTLPPTDVDKRKIRTTLQAAGFL